MIGALVSRLLLISAAASLIMGAVDHFHINQARDELAGKIEGALN